MPSFVDVLQHLGGRRPVSLGDESQIEFASQRRPKIGGGGYLTSANQEWDVPRRSSPRTKVPTGSVALAGRFTGVYPRESPGGWQLIGRTDLAMFDLSRDPAALLRPGNRGRFFDVGAS